MIMLDNTDLCVGRGDGRIQIFEFDSSNLDNIKQIKVLHEHKDDVTSLIEIPGNKLISGSIDKSIKFWEMESYLCLKTVGTGLQ